MWLCNKTSESPLLLAEVYFLKTSLSIEWALSSALQSGYGCVKVFLILEIQPSVHTCTTDSTGPVAGLDVHDIELSALSHFAHPRTRDEIHGALGDFGHTSENKIVFQIMKHTYLTSLRRHEEVQAMR